MSWVGRARRYWNDPEFRAKCVFNTRRSKVRRKAVFAGKEKA